METVVYKDDNSIGSKTPNLDLLSGSASGWFVKTR